MQSSIIGKIEKARRYAAEPDRVKFEDFSLTFRGDNDTHTVTLHDEHWHCTCDFYADYDMCCHTMALERMLGDMLPAKVRDSLMATA